MMEIFGALIAAFIVSVSTIKILLPLAPQIGLVDIPNARKQHDGSIPLIGGISIYTGVLIASSLFIEQSQILNLYFISSALLVFVGTLDDIYDLSVAPRIIFQALVATVMVFGAELYISDLGNLFALGTVDIGPYGMIFTVIVCIGAINAFNMIDGIDGLAGSLSIVSISAVAILMLLNDPAADILLLQILIVSILPFLFYNVSTRNPRGKKIFMGDAGSMYMGLTVIWLLAIGTQDSVIGEASFSPVTALWVVAIPIMDMVAIMIRRIIRGNSPFKADNGHIHHIVLKLGFSSRHTLWIITALASSLALFGIYLESAGYPESFSFVMFLITFALYSSLNIAIWKKVKNK